jgi:hypothetical protein
MSIPIGTPPGVHPGPFDPTVRQSAAKTERPAPGNAFARVYELEEARRRRGMHIQPMAGDRIPDEVWDEVDAAARLFDRLHAEGSRVVFDTDRLSGRVVASLLDSEGGQKALPLTDAVDPAASRPTQPPAPFGNGATPGSALPAGGLRAVYGGDATSAGTSPAPGSGGQV